MIIAVHFCPPPPHSRLISKGCENCFFLTCAWYFHKTSYFLSFPSLLLLWPTLFASIQCGIELAGARGVLVHGAATKQAATRALLSKVQSTNRRNIGEKERRKDRLGQGKEGKISPFMYLASLLLARPLLHTLLASHTSIPGLLLEQRQKKVKTLLRHYDTWYGLEKLKTC